MGYSILILITYVTTFTENNYNSKRFIITNCTLTMEMKVGLSIDDIVLTLSAVQRSTLQIALPTASLPWVLIVGLRMHILNDRTCDSYIVLGRWSTAETALKQPAAYDHPQGHQLRH